MKIALSACLSGAKVRYDGTDKFNKELMELIKGHEIICICPEIAAGFSIPHLPIERKGEKIIDSKGNDHSDILYKACIKEYERIKDCDIVILKSKSPSCGYQGIYDGTFSNKLIDGNGLFCEICLSNNLKVFNEKQLQEIEEILKRLD